MQYLHKINTELHNLYCLLLHLRARFYFPDKNLSEKWSYIVKHVQKINEEL